MDVDTYVFVKVLMYIDLCICVHGQCRQREKGRKGPNANPSWHPQVKRGPTAGVCKPSVLHLCAMVWQEMEMTSLQH